ncbi:hypothetical protein D3C87_1625830 [compost metagenome]
MEGTREFRNEVDSAANRASSAVNKASGKAQHAISDMAHSFGSSAEEVYHNMEERARRAADASEDFVHKHPFSTVLGAAAVGLVAGILLRRR